MPPSQFSIIVANAAAKGHYDTAMSRYAEFAKSAKDANSSEDSSKFQEMLAFGIPIITHLALALEFQLKILHFQHTGIYPRGHDIAKLGSEFPSETLDALRSAYLKVLNDKAMPDFLYMAVGASSRSPEEKSPWPGDAKTYDDAILRVGRSYERWRYIYEEFGETLEITLDFKPLAVLTRAVNYCVGHFKGNGKVQVKSESYNVGPQ